MDPYEELCAKAKKIASQLVTSRKRTATYTSKDGVKVQGWLLHSFTVEPEESHWGSGWKESWGKMELILTIEGEFCIYREHHVEQSDRPRQDSASFEPATPGLLVNLGSGKPFMKATELLERLPYTLD